MSRFKNSVILIWSAALILLLVTADLFTKELACHHLKGNASVKLIDGVLEFLYVENRGAAFSMLENARWFFIIVAAAAAVCIIILLIRMPISRHFIPLRLSLLFIFAGAVGNLIDRITLSYVRDFIYFSLIDFPVFNVADMYVTCATAILIVLVLFYYKDEDFLWIKKTKVSI